MRFPLFGLVGVLLTGLVSLAGGASAQVPVDGCAVSLGSSGYGCVALDPSASCPVIIGPTDDARMGAACGEGAARCALQNQQEPDGGLACVRIDPEGLCLATVDGTLVPLLDGIACREGEVVCILKQSGTYEYGCADADPGADCPVKGGLDRRSVRDLVCAPDGGPICAWNNALCLRFDGCNLEIEIIGWPPVQVLC